MLDPKRMRTALETPVGSTYAGLNNFVSNETAYEEMVEVFVDLLDKEIKKVYLGYTEFEKKIYVKINSRLHMRDSYE